MTTSIMWFRRDLRLSDHPALLAAQASADHVLPLFVVDPALSAPATPRANRLFASVQALAKATDGALVVRTGDPRRLVPELAKEVGASEVHVTRETTPYGRRRDERVASALARAGRSLVATGTPYAVGPGTLLSSAGTPYQVFTPWERAWSHHGFPAPATRPDPIPWHRGVPGEAAADSRSPESPDGAGWQAGEEAALGLWADFLRGRLGGYADHRDRPDLDQTSRLSVPLKYGEIHPRTILSGIAASPHARSEGAARFITELGWREFYADVLWHRPQSAWRDLREDLSGMQYDSGPATDALVDAWREGRTGFPLVDAGMRQLLHDGWMHNRVRMVTASFLSKDLHVWWPVGARHFLDHLLDGDIASNNHGWQWVAATGTDSAPYFRIFNPVAQGLRYDPDGEYVRRWVPELRHLPGPAVHEPWRHPLGHSHGYAGRILDHAEARAEALDRYQRARRG